MAGLFLCHLANETLLSAVEAGASKLSGQWAA